MVSFSKEVVVVRTFEMSAEEFVKTHLKEVRQFGSELDLFVQDGVNANFITSVITLKDSELIDFGGSYFDFNLSAQSVEERERHISACGALVKVLELKFKKES